MIYKRYIYNIKNLLAFIELITLGTVAVRTEYNTVHNIQIYGSQAIMIYLQIKSHDMYI
jgi:hypothetical protein